MKRLILMFLLFSTLASCRYFEDYSNLKGMKELKNSLTSSGSFELNDETQELLTKYFGTIKELLFKIQNDSRMERYFHRKFFRYYVPNLCEDSLLSKSFYNQIMSKCVVNDFYVCTDEARYFEQILGKLYMNLTEAEKDKLASEAACRDLLESYKLNLGI